MPLCRRALTVSYVLTASLALLALPEAALANCTGTTNVTCTVDPPNPYTQRIGNGQSSPGVTVTVNPNARIAVGNSNAISLGDNANITLGSGASVTNVGTSSQGQWGAGPNTVEFGSNGRLTVAAGASIAANGTQNNGEPVNVMGIGNVITNRGTISSQSGAAILFEDKTTGGTNTVDNYGIVRTQLGANANVIGNSRDGNVTFINRTGARVEGSLSFAGGNDNLTLEAGSVITGGFNGGGGTNTLTLSGAADSSDSLGGDIRNFQTLTKNGEGRWTLTGAVGANGGNAALQVLVQQGTLALTGNNANFNGRVTVDSAGTLEARAQSLPPTITDNGTVRFVQDTAGTYSGTISGSGFVEKALGGDLTLAGVNSYSGGTLVTGGTLYISSDANLGVTSGSLTLNGGSLGSTATLTVSRQIVMGPLSGGLAPAANTTMTVSNRVTGTGQLIKNGAGTVVLTTANSYSGGTTIASGVLEISSNANLGTAAAPVTFTGGTLRTTADMTTARRTTLGTGGGTIETASGTTFTDNSVISGTGALTKTGSGTLILSNAGNSYTGGTAINGGTVQINDNANLGAPTGALSFDGGTLRIANGTTIDRATTLNTNGGAIEAGGDPNTQADFVTVNGTIAGSGNLTKLGSGSLVLNGTGSYNGNITVVSGSLFVNGDLSGVTGDTTIFSGARLSGGGTLGGTVLVQGGARLSAGEMPGQAGILTVGNLSLSSNSQLFVNMIDTNVGGALNDLINVNGNLVLDGRVDILEQNQNLGPGVYRVINYTGALTDHGLDIGNYLTLDGTVTRPLTGFSVQTVVPGQVNLINTTGLSLNYWDGSATQNKNNRVIEGGVGTWFNAGPDSTFAWTDPTGAVNAPWADGQFAIFIGSGDVVTVSNDDGDIHASGMQFGVTGYQLVGDPINLVDAPDSPGISTIRVGDGTSASTAMTATIAAPLTGSTLLRKTDGGTLILSGVNSYSGGTRIEGGAIEIAADTALGQSGTGVSFNSGTLRTTDSFATARAMTLDGDGGTLEQTGGTTFQVDTAIGGVGALTKAGAGTLLLTAENAYGGGTTISEGRLQLGNGGTSGSITGDVVDNGELAVNRSDTVTLGALISGTGTFEQAGTGTTILTADNSFAGRTTISAGTLQLGDGGTAGSVAGPITNNATLAFNRSDRWTLASDIDGSGTVVQRGSGVTVLTGTNRYSGATSIQSGWLYIDGDQSGAGGPLTADSGTRLGGGGTIGGSVTIANGATFAPGAEPQTPATLTINGSLTLNQTSNLFYNVVQANVAGGQLNDLAEVRGDLVLDGVINILDQGQTLGPGVYRIINYGGTLTDHELEIGSFMSAQATPQDVSTPTRPLDGLSVQTSIPGQVNLVSTGGLTFNYWDVNPKNNGAINGGSGTWQASAGTLNDNWTGPDGAVNAPWADAAFAIFQATPGTVQVDNGEGAVSAIGMQFGSSGYHLIGDQITLVPDLDRGGVTTIRVGDGTAAGASMIATIDNVLLGGAALVKDDLGTLILNGANLNSGGLVIDAGTLQVSEDQNLGAASGAVAIFNGAVLRASASFASSRPIFIGNTDPASVSGGTIETADGFTLTYGGTIADIPAATAGALTKTGGGTLILTNANTYSGGTTISAGTLQLGDGGETGSIAGPIVDNAVLIVNRSNALTIADTISGTGSLTQAGTGTTILAANNEYTGGTLISAGTLQIGDGGTTGHVVGDIEDNATLVINRSDTKLTPGVISGTGKLIQAGTGITVLQADNSYTGGTEISAGTLQLGDGGTAGSIVGDVLDNGTLAFNRSDDIVFSGSITGSGGMEHLGPGKTTLTGLNIYTGGTRIRAGTVQVGDGGTSGTIYGDIVNDGVLILNRSDDLVYGGSVSGTGSTIKEGAGLFVVTGTGTYTGGTTINQGVLQLGDGGTTGSILGDIVDNAKLAVNRSDSFLINGVISGTGSFEQMGPGTTIFEANNSYTGGTLISQGTLQIGNGGTTGLVPGDVVNNGRLVINRSNTKYLEGIVSGTGEVVQIGLGTLIIDNTNSYSGGTAIEAGILQISRDDNLGTASGGLRIANAAVLHTTADMTTARDTVLAQGGGTFEVDAGTTLTHNGALDGAGGLAKTGAGMLVLTGNANAYAGPTDVLAGTLRVNGDQTAATGLTTVAAGATLGGGGIIGGDVSIGDGGILAPGNSPGTLTINGSLTLAGGAVLNYEFGEAGVPGGALNDLTVVNGNLTLDGTINVSISAGGAFDPGIYRVFNYAGTLTDNGLSVGTIPAAGYFVQTSVAGQVNLVNTTGLTLTYWDGAAGPKNDGTVNGGNGTWQNPSGNDNWTSETGTPNAPFTDAALAIFTGVPGTVTVDDSLGPVNVTGMQFAVDGYVVQGDAINMVGVPGTLLRVGDGNDAGAAMTATINAVLAGDSALTKSDLGTLVLTGANTYTGGTVINEGVVRISSDANLGAASGGVTLNGGTLSTTADLTSGRAITLGAVGGAIETAAGTTFTAGGAITGGGSLTKTGDGTLALTADNDFAGGTTISAGTLQIGNGGTSGSLAGDITNNATLAVNRSDTVTIGGVISGSGAFVQSGTGTTILTGANSYTGATSVTTGTLLVNGDQTAATGLTSVTGGTIGGTGTVGGSVAIAAGGTLSPGGAGGAPGTLTIAGGLTLDAGATLAYDFGQANVVGGPLNDLTVVAGPLTLDGTINVSVSAGGSIDPGIYRVISYAGTLTNNGLTIGDMPAAGFAVQTSIAGQVNLINTGGLTLNFWDGDAGPKSDGTVNGGNGLWQSSSGNDNWTTETGALNAPYTDAVFAIFQGSPGTVTVDGSLGAINSSGMQFAVGGYVVQGDPINLVGESAVIRVGDGTGAGAGMTTTIGSVLTGDATLTKTDLGTLILTGANSYAGGTAVNGGVLQIASDTNLGAADGALGLAGGTLRNTDVITTERTVTLGTGGGTFETLADLTLAGTIGGEGGLTKAGAGTLTLTGGNSYAGPTTVSAGTLYVEGTQGGATGPVSVADGATLGGSGTIGGSVAIADGGRLSPGTAGTGPGTLTIAQDLTLSPNGRLVYEFGRANVVGGPLNDLTIVQGDLALDGIIDITPPPGGSMDPGVYRVIDYAGTLTNNGLEIGAAPTAGFFVQTSIAQQVNLINTAGLTLNFWDGDAGPKNDGAVNGGNGLWQNTSGNDNWTTANGTPNAPFTDGAFAIFQGSPGTVTVDGSLGPVNASGMQFAVDGYVVSGAPVNLVGGIAVIRVGDGTTAGADMTATIRSVLTGNAALTKSDLGTLILTGVNSYTGGTAVNGGVLQIGSDAALGAAAGGLSIDGATLRTTADIATNRAVAIGAGGAIFDTQADTDLTIGAGITGSGGLAKTGGGSLVLLGAGTYAGPTIVDEGLLAVGDRAGTSASIAGPVMVAEGATLGGYGAANGDVTNAGTIAVADALPRFAGSGPGQFIVGGTLTNGGTVLLGGAGVGNRLVANSYVGVNGTIQLNTTLAGDNAPTDQLVINGGTATGNTLLRLTNVGGAGADTPGNGIQLVVAAAGATTSAGAFGLSDRVVAGPYEYNLFRGGRDGSEAESWFLRSEAPAGAIPPPGPYIPPTEPPEPPSPEPPLFRPEVPTYTATPAMALMLGRSLIGTLHDRVGDEAPLSGRMPGGSGAISGAWGRMVGERSNWDAEPGGVYRDGPAFRSSNYAMQLGFDLLRSAPAKGGFTVAGVYGAYGWSEGIVRDYDMSPAGRTRFDTYTGGVYATHYTSRGWYADAVAQVTRYMAKAGSSFFEDVSIKGTGVAASLEVGAPLALGGGLSLEPQGQIIWQSIDFKNTADPAADVRFDDVNSLTGRLGFRLVHNGERAGAYGPRPITTWVRANVWREFSGNPKTSFSSEDGYIPFRSDIRATWAEFGAGISAEMTRGASLFASGSRQTAFGGEMKAWNVRAGLRFNW